MKNKILGEFSKYTSLNILGMLGLSCYILADTYFVQKGMGSNGLAALNLAIPVYSIINGIGLMTGIGGATRFSIDKNISGEKNKNKSFTSSVLICAVFSAVFILAGLFFTQDISLLLGANDETLEMCSTYMTVILLFSPMFMMNNIIQAFMRNDSNPQFATAAMLTGSFANIILDYVFIFPLNMGIFGAALATGIAPVIGLLIMSVCFITKRTSVKLQKCRIEFSYVIKMTSAGIPALVTELSSCLVMIVFNLIMLKLEGNTGVAAYGIIANLSLVVISVYTGISQGTQPLVSRFYATDNTKDMKKIMKYSAVLSIIVSAAVYLSIFLFSDTITAVFNSENDLRLAEIAQNGLKLYFIGCFFAGLNIPLSSYFSATEKTVQGSVTSVLRGILLIIPAAFIMSSIFGTNGLWLSFFVTELITLIVAFVLYLKS